VATVKDTETFIVAARAIHGSRYDYSKTVFTRSDSPVTIGCRICGPFVLKQAESHYRGKKQCGCKTCNKKASLRKSGRFHVCRKCRKWAIYKDSQGYCRDCKGQASLERTEKKQLLVSAVASRPCKVCGKAIGTGNKRQVVCSKECGHKGRIQEKVELSCCNCGKKVERYKSRLKFRSVFACSLECQRQYALEDNRGKPHGEIDWLKKSAETRQRWKASQSRKRRLCNPWMRKIVEKISNCKRSQVDTKGWEYRVALRISSAIGRKRRRQIEAKASKTVEQALRKIRSKRKLFELSDWEKKIGWKLSSHKSRRARKGNAQKHRQVEGLPDRREDQGKWIQVRFEWVGD